MQGQPGQGNEPWNKSSSRRYPAVNGHSTSTGKVPSIPQRPQGMVHIDQPPPTPRVARPVRETPSPGKKRRRLLIWVVVLIIVGIVIGGGVFAAINFLGAIQVASGPATTAGDFLGALNTGNYDQAYNDFDVTITIQLDLAGFKQQAARVDSCMGTVTNYTLLDNSTVLQDTTASSTYNITRSKLSQAYPLRLTFAKNTDGNWKITSFGNSGTGNDLAPGQPICN